MKVFLGQIYVEPGASFPFSHRMQVWLGDQVSALAVPSAEFVDSYGGDYSLGVRISARRKLLLSDIQGPTVFKKTKDVEYTLFLPYDTIMDAEDGCRLAAELIVGGIGEICARANIECPGFEAVKSAIVEEICSNPAMLKKPWPASP